MAYIIYTSGTTGLPKGVIQPHKNVVSLFRAADKIYHFDQNDRWLLFHSFVFDFSVWEIWGALFYGAELVIPTYEQTKDMHKIFDLCYNKKITVLNQTPSAFYSFLDIAIKKNIKLINLKYIIFGGEALVPFQLKDWVKHYSISSPKLVNMYGITEITVHATFKFLEEKDLKYTSNIGKKLDDLKFYIVDENLLPVPIGAIGELHIGGSRLASGYLNKKELSEHKFIKNPFIDQNEKKISYTKLYKTGDLVRLTSSGDLEFIGRNDNQVKIRGYRIELEEIQFALNTINGVKQSVVVVKENDKKGLFNKKHLICYYVSDQKLDHELIIKQLKIKLPEYMLPNFIIHMDKFPLTVNGKLDMSALPEYEFLKLSR
ncbi:MAG: AMP-binding protein [Arcobacter sp.]|nr:AMP-binding protein [Arcobacter sp.]